RKRDMPAGSAGTDGAASVLDPVGDVNAAVLEGPALAQLQVGLAGHRVKRRDARAEKHRGDVEPDLVDQSGLEQRPGQLPAAHPADVLAALLVPRCID